MIFKDRVDAGKQLAEKLQKIIPQKKRTQVVVVSLLRGGFVVGRIIANILKTPHIPLIAIKISSPFNSEYAIGALCHNSVYLNPVDVSLKDKTSEKIKLQIQIAKTKHSNYENIFKTKNINYSQILKNKLVILVDDGVATGATINASQNFLIGCGPKSLHLTLPVSPYDYHPDGFSNCIILYKAKNFSAVSQFYQDFLQISDDEILKK